MAFMVGLITIFGMKLVFKKIKTLFHSLFNTPKVSYYLSVAT